MAGLVTVQCFFSNQYGGSIRIHIASAFGSLDVVVLGGTQVDVLLREGPKVISIFDLSDGSLIITATINVSSSVSQPTWTILSGGLLQFPDGHTIGGSGGSTGGGGGGVIP
jgi:hypothetical protein